VNGAGRAEPAVWALHLAPIVGPAVLVVLQLPGELDAPPAVHGLLRCPDWPDRCLTSLGWCRGTPTRRPKTTKADESGRLASASLLQTSKTPQ
jgi:hypothetical protein